jgi:hypothetical protein
MANLDGSRPNGARFDMVVGRALSADPSLRDSLYRRVVAAARAAGIDAHELPDFLLLETDSNRGSNESRTKEAAWLREFAESPAARAREIERAQRAAQERPEKSGRFRALAGGEAQANGELQAPKVARSELALSMRSGGATLAEIGEALGVTRERARQILAKTDGPSTGDVRSIRVRQMREADEGMRDRVVSFLRRNPPMSSSTAAAELIVPVSELRRLLGPAARTLLLPEPGANVGRGWTRDRVATVLQEASTFEYPLTSTAYKELRRTGFIKGPSVPRITQVFGSWLGACDYAGVEAGTTRRVAYSSRWTRADLVAAVRTFLEDQPERTFSAYSEWARGRDEMPSGPTLRNRLGTWSDIVKIAMTKEPEVPDAS